MKTLKAAINESNRPGALNRALNELHNVGPGNAGRYQQVRQAIVNELPLRDQREYTVDQLIDALFTWDEATERYTRND